MKFYKVTCITDVELGRPWFYSDRPSRAFGNGLFLIPDDASDAFKRGDDETTFRLLAAVADPRHDLADLEACVLETRRAGGGGINAGSKTRPTGDASESSAPSATLRGSFPKPWGQTSSARSCKSSNA